MLLKYGSRLIGAVLLLAPIQSNATVIDSGGGQFVWTDLVGIFSPTQANSSPGAVNVVMSGVNPLTDLGSSFSSGDQIHISRIAIAGDSRATSGDNRFRLVSGGGGTDFTWVAGQQSTPADYRLAPTPEPGTVPGNSTGFSYFSVDYTLNADEIFTVSWDYHVDYDGRFAGATDILGNAFNDSAFPSSIRAWVQFDVVSGAVPEPASLVPFVLGIVALGYARRKRTA
tara:strand:- start:312 stop:992 length:681 start_codon:yes stop_codon:yes gene_type:complete